MDENRDPRYQAGYDALYEGQFERARMIAQELMEEEDEAGYEIMALIRLEVDDDLPSTTTLLKGGVEKFPKSWLLWQLLGNCLSDSELFEDAIHCYDEALQCPGVHINSVRYNQGVVFRRQEQYRESLDTLAHILTPYDADPEGYHLPEEDEARDLMEQALTFRLCLYNDLHRYEDTMTFSESLYQRCEDDDDRFELSNDSLGDLYSYWAYALWKTYPENPQEVRRALAQAYAIKALEYSRLQELALWLVRDIDADKDPTLKSDHAKHFHILVEGRWETPLDPEIQEATESSGFDANTIPGFLTSYDVVADTLDEAMTFVQRFEPEVFHPSMRVDEVEEQKLDNPLPKGVYDRSPYILFDPDAEDNPGDGEDGDIEIEGESLLDPSIDPSDVGLLNLDHIEDPNKFYPPGKPPSSRTDSESNPDSDKDSDANADPDDESDQLT